MNVAQQCSEESVFNNIDPERSDHTREYILCEPLDFVLFIYTYECKID